ncbi:(2E,6E)-farnesyl diphosphate synthase [Lysobacter brunescens]|uniref:(2E,6E)-farnesyl diphosphate synthase n=1 Tax=Lysobacter brunescens TaxID=262323 RepID=A0ABW2YH01_9GAMM
MATALAHWRQRADDVLEQALRAHALGDTRLQAAMRHAALLGGKRMRPLLVYATGRMLGASDAALDAPASAVELIHAYSLVHDDLPAMDDDALRRGQPTVHVAFDEATAILAGDALQTLAFRQLADAPAPAEVRIAMVRELATASGALGMCGGQAFDIDATGRGGDIGLAELERLHAMKTGALLRCAVRLGALAGGADITTQAALDRYAEALGLAFQIRDDLLDIEADSATLGKTAGKDVAQNKATFPALLGVDGSRARLADLRGVMADAIAPFGDDAAALAELARMVVERSH